MWSEENLCYVFLALAGYKEREEGMEVSWGGKEG